MEFKQNGSIEQVKRNGARFPDDFMFRLTKAETEFVNRSQFATGSQKHRDPRFPPYAFTEHGAIMAATVLNSARAIEMSVYVVRAFIRLREILGAHSELAKKLDALEARYDHQFSVVFTAIRKLMEPSVERRKTRLGFRRRRSDDNLAHQKFGSRGVLKKSKA